MSETTAPGRDCALCPRLAEYRAANRAKEPGWHNAPVPSWGQQEAPLLVLGLAPGVRGANRTGRPFTGDYAGKLLYTTLLEYGLARGAYGEDPKDARVRAAEILRLVGLNPETMNRLPHEFSGGQRQRIGLARALMLKPDVLIADEPVSALDVTVQAQVLKLLDDVRQQMNLAMLFITHDMRVAAQVCHRVMVMRHGQVVESGPTREIFAAPSSDYTRALLAAIPGRGLLAAV